MVTFSIPGDEVVDAGANGTPRSRPPLPFAKRANSTASPFGGSSSIRRLGTPHATSARKLLTTRDDLPSSSLGKGTISAARNIFRASTITDSPPTSSFSPNIPQSTMKKVFAPGATPEPSRIYRESVAHATPQGMAAKATSRELFPMRIPSPPPELTGEVLTQKVPQQWNSKGSIYADQFLAHLCPPELDEEQRRQFFCILDLRRLKYAANEIFAKKDWKLNVVNFAKEFEKSRSIILLRYGLYEFQNVKPSKEVLKRWRREHGLPEPEDEQDESETTPSKSTAAKKRKADDVESSEGKRRATDRPTQPEVATVASTSLFAASPAGSRNKRKASDANEQPTKMQKATPSSAKSLFEKITNKAAAKPASEESQKPAMFTSSKSSGGSSLARSVFTNLKTNGNPTAQAGTASSNGNNIFGYLSDASSAKNSGVDADAESETDEESEQDEEDSPEAGQSDGPSVAASSQAGSNLFTKKPPVGASNLGASTAISSAPDTRESTPGRSLFERVTKGSDGQPVRAEGEVIEHEEELAPAKSDKTTISDQTWNPTTTPIKFAPRSSTAPTGSIFGSKPSSTSVSSLFGTKTSAPSTAMFGPKSQANDVSLAEGRQDGGESDKENESQPTKSALFETKPSTSTLFGPGAGQPKLPATEVPKETEAAKLTGAEFGASSKPTDVHKPTETRFAGNLFGQAAKPTDTVGSSATPSTAESSTPFGTKLAAPTEQTGTSASANETAKAAPSLFGATNTSTANARSSGSLFGGKATSTTTSLFGSGASTPSQHPSMFGATSKDNADSNTAQKPDKAQAPIFNFAGAGGAGVNGLSTQAETGAKSLFGAPKSPPAGTSSNMFGSPMKQDEASPAKKAFGVSTSDGNSTPQFAFGGSQSAGPASGGNLFGGASAPAHGSGSSSSFGPSAAAAPAAAPAAAGTGSFNFSFGAAGATPGETFNNPFSSGSVGGPGSGSATGLFSFESGSAAPSGSSTPFQFGAGTGGTSTPTNNGATAFGNASTGPTFSFSAGGANSQGSGPGFGSNQAAPAVSLQPPAGGSTTTGTNSPLNLGGGSSLATTPAAGTPEPSGPTDLKDGENEDGEHHEQINLTAEVDQSEEVLHEVRAKVLKFIPASDKPDDEKPKSKSPWTTQGVGKLRLLKHKDTGVVRLLLRGEPRGNIAINRAVLPRLNYKADEKYVKLTTSNEKGDGLETWMIQVKTKEFAKALAEALELHKESNK